MDALQQIGQTQPAALAATKAFEAYLLAKASSWTSEITAKLPIEFLVAFSQELGALGIQHRVRTSQLTAGEVRVLSSPPFSAFVDQATLRLFQEVPGA